MRTSFLFLIAALLVFSNVNTFAEGPNKPKRHIGRLCPNALAVFVRGNTRRHENGEHELQIDESPDSDPRGEIREGITKLFEAGNPTIKYSEIEDAGLSHIKDVDKATNFALDLAREIAANFRYTDNEIREVFQKK
ncbi:MAG: hypothetical protein JWQ35_1680 [Bacteriovoracaceae bacterium]|nr:hypothetical protein [Bacteriovoracaceae bacterium]